PTLSGLAATSVNEGQTSTLTGTITDPGTQDSFTVVVNWGDGSTNDTFTLVNATALTFTRTHQYIDDNPTGTPSDAYTVSVSVVDDDTGSTSGSTSVTVTN